MSVTSQGGERKAKSNRAGSIYHFLKCTTGEYMTHSVITVRRDVTMRQLETLFEQHDFNSIPVVDEGKVVGIVSKFDFLRAFAFTTDQIVPHYDELMQRTVAQMMTEAVVDVEPTTPLTRVLQLMVSRMTRSFPVLTPEGQLVGMISREDESCVHCARRPRTKTTSRAAAGAQASICRARTSGQLKARPALAIELEAS